MNNYVLFCSVFFVCL